MRQKQNLQTQPVVIESRYLVTRIFLITKSSLLCDAIDLTQTLDNIILQVALSPRLRFSSKKVPYLESCPRYAASETA